MSNPVVWVDCPVCGLARGIAEVMGGNYYVLRTCGHVIAKDQASGLVIEEVM